MVENSRTLKAGDSIAHCGENFFFQRSAVTTTTFVDTDESIILENLNWERDPVSSFNPLKDEKLKGVCMCV